MGSGVAADSEEPALALGVGVSLAWKTGDTTIWAL
jgi:hypothetical protein